MLLIGKSYEELLNMVAGPTRPKSNGSQDWPAVRQDVLHQLGRHTRHVTVPRGPIGRKEDLLQIESVMTILQITSIPVDTHALSFFACKSAHDGQLGLPRSNCAPRPILVAYHTETRPL